MRRLLGMGMYLTASVVETLICQCFGISGGKQRISCTVKSCLLLAGGAYSFLMELITAMVKGEALSVVYVLILILNARLDTVRNIGQANSRERIIGANLLSRQRPMVQG